MLLLCSLGLLVGRRAPATSRAGCVRCGEEDSLHQLMAALRDEAAKRGRDSDLGKFEKLRKLGPQGQTSPKQVVEHVVLQLGAGNDEAAFAFTSLPPWRAGTHRSNTDWSKRMDWAKSRVISGQPSGALVDESSFGQLLSERFAFLRQTQAYRLVGDDSEWQQKRGREKMTAVKEYVVEVETADGEDRLVKFVLVYNWRSLPSPAALLSASSASRCRPQRPSRGVRARRPAGSSTATSSPTSPCCQPTLRGTSPAPARTCRSTTFRRGGRGR